MLRSLVGSEMCLRDSLRYCWVSDYLTESKPIPRDINPDCMIPMASIGDESNNTNEKLLIGNNVAFDRSFVKEAYQLKVRSKTNLICNTFFWKTNIMFCPSSFSFSFKGKVLKIEKILL